MSAVADFFRKWQHSILAHAHQQAYADAHAQGASQLKTSRVKTADAIKLPF